MHACPWLGRKLAGSAPVGRLRLGWEGCGCYLGLAVIYSLWLFDIIFRFSGSLSLRMLVFLLKQSLQLIYFHGLPSHLRHLD
jgi:hypothetical protein